MRTRTLFVSDVLGAGPHCAVCIARKTGVRDERLRSMLDYIGAAVPIITKHELCDGCGQETVVYRLGGI